MDIAFFDFDGTITKRDSFIEFIVHAVGKDRFTLGFMVLSPVILAYKLKIIPNYRAKEIVLSFFFKGLSLTEFNEACRSYSETKLDTIVKPSAMERIKWHKERGDKVVVVSASIENWLVGWTERNGLELLSTKLNFTDDKFTGKFSTKNCHGQEKVDRIKKTFDLSEYNEIYAYGDSSGDTQMLAMADHGFYRNFA